MLRNLHRFQNGYIVATDEYAAAILDLKGDAPGGNGMSLNVFNKYALRLQFSSYLRDSETSRVLIKRRDYRTSPVDVHAPQWRCSRSAHHLC
ncbi:hypothetical protein [Caballeronia sp. S22]|uniref:hypothetical protein n=1 Tax=Caballeronia sp. S22 TaxID=3137182 RepID=UPI0035314996